VRGNERKELPENEAERQMKPSLPTPRCLTLAFFFLSVKLFVQTPCQLILFTNISPSFYPAAFNF
jgi:hypothetical protein